MQTLKSLLPLAVLAVSATPALAVGQVEVKFVKPEQFSDIGFGTMERERTLKSLTDAMQALGGKLHDGQTLRLEVTDVDLAGELQPRGGRDLRILRGRADWPRMDIRWSLVEGGRTLKSGESRLADMGYMSAPRSLQYNGSGLDYERRMLKEWFEQTIVSP